MVYSASWASIENAPFRFTGSSSDNGWYPMIQINLTNGKYILGLYNGSFCGCRILNSQPNTPQWSNMMNGNWANVW